jgi:amino acid adenylation domain-containing protein
MHTGHAETPPDVEPFPTPAPALSKAERHKLLIEWNATAMPYAEDKCLHQLFESQALRTPEAIALHYGNENLTYAELNARAEHLATRLRRLGIGPEVLAAICLHRTERMLIAILAVLKAGGAYVPVDPAYPQERIDFILRDGNAPLLITESGIASIAPPRGTQLLLLDPGWENEPAPDAGPRVLPNPASTNLAYVIYTSGSTGLPKGVAIEHRNAVALVSWARTIFTDAELAGVLLSTSICFDLSIFEMFVPLAWGGTVILAENALALPTLPCRELVSLINTVPSAIRELVRIGGIPGSVRVVNLAGEALLTPLVDDIYACSAVAKVYDLYGPSETTTYSTFTLRQPGGPATVGKPIGNEKIYLLDPARNLVPIGVAGEIYIGGHGVVRGYLGRPELTAERFIASPFNPAERLYRTGDLGRWRPDGNLEFLGRMDHQVKIRGYRIELGEIESVLRSHPGVRDCAVLAREDIPGDKRLVAYIAGNPTNIVLIDYLRTQLPDYMIPAAFVFLDALPLTPNRKLDRKALPAPAYSSRAAEHIPPATPLEQGLANAWQQILGIDHPGLLDNFFSLGGHSLLGIRLISRLREEINLELPLRAIFEHPTLGALASHIESLRSGSVSRSLLPELLPAPRDAHPPLSFAQQRLWFLDQLAPGSSAYNVPQAFRLCGDLNFAALESALGEIVSRHESLRTLFAQNAGEAFQVILPPAPFKLPIIDLPAVPESAREERMAQCAREDALAPFDLARGPLFRAALLRFSGKDHALLLNIHHIVSDGWSMGVLARELSALYSSYKEERPSPLVPLPVQYADFAHWQRTWLTGDLLASQLTWWTRHLAGANFTLPLPADHPAPPTRKYEAAELRFSCPPGLTQALHTTSREGGATLFMTLLAAFQVLLHRLTGQEDLVIGTALAGRNHAHTEQLIGFFVNTLPLRGSVAGDPTFRACLAQVRESVLGMFAHQDLPFERLVQALNPGRDTSQSPLFQVMFTMDDGLDAATQLAGLETTPFRSDCVAAKFDLTLTLAETEGRLDGWFVYDTDLFEPQTISRIASHFGVLLESITAAPGQPVYTLPILTAAEKQHLLVDLNDTRRPYPAESVHALFAAQAARAPDAIAIAYGETKLTYCQLDERADQLALYLRSMNSGSPVAVYMERSADLIVALLAVLKSGTAYIPIEPPFPEERLATILAETRAGVVLTDQISAASLPPLNIPVAIADGPIPSNAAPKVPIQDFTVHTPAYIIYTSGSTGTPKGVVITHRAINRLVLNTDYAQLTSADVVAQASTAAFDAATFEIWGALLNGATLVIIPRDDLLSPRNLAAAIERHRISALFLTTALFNLLARENSAVFHGITHLLFGGEASDPACVRAVLQAGPPANLLHMYGPTETTTFATWHRVTEVPADAVTIPIGRPIANTTAYILDPRLNPAPTGVPGELYIGGDGVALGYLNSPELNTEKFIRAPFDPEARLYRTGDLARWNADGNIEFIGRIDQQVKIRGFRIEPGEIEAVLRRYPAVRDCSVLAREDTPGEKRLVAYIAGGATETALREHLRTKLPEYMVPAAFVALDTLPLTPNGKLDRKALPAPDYSNKTDEHAPAQTPLEKTLAAAWQKILHIPEPGLLDNFFQLGGHSLLAIRLVSRLREALNLELPLRAIFEHQTLGALAAHIESLRSAAATDLLPTIHPLPRDAHPPLSFAQQRLWFLDQLAPGSSAYNIPQAFRLRGDLKSDALQAALAAIIERHESLRTTFSYEGDHPSQVIHPTVPYSLPFTNLYPLPESERAAELLRLSHDDSFTPFDLTRGPLFRATLIRLGPSDHVLLLTIHHIIADGWSMGILASELSALYAAFLKGKPSPLPPLPIQYADFVQWQRNWLQGAVLDRQLTYWKQQLAGDLPVLSLPADHPRPAVPTDRAGTITATLPGNLSRSLRALCEQEGVTLFMLLLAAFDALIGRLSGQEEIIVGSPIAGRNSPETEHLIGFFVNTLVLRISLAGDPPFRDFLARVREVTLGAYTHQDLPFEKLVEELNPERRLGHTPLFQVMLNMLSTAPDPPRLENFNVQVIPTEQHQSKFDLTLYATDKGEAIHLDLVFNAELFSVSRMEEMLGQFSHVLAQISARPTLPLSAISLLTDSAKAALPDPTAPLIKADPAPGLPTIPDHFREIARRHATRTALTDANSAWTYSQLDSATEALASQLHPGNPAAIWASRDTSLAIGILAALKAGAPFVILDPAYPEPRLLDLLSIARPEAWLDCATAPTLPPGLEQFASALRVRIPLPADPGAQSAGTKSPSRTASQTDLAYIAFTSGSRGRPKAITATQLPLAHFLDWHSRQYSLSESDRFSVLSGLAHDPLLRDILAPLWAGATACFPKPEIFESPAGFRAWMKEEAITVSHVTPSMAAILTDSAEPNSLPTLRHFFFGGDILQPETVNAVLSAAPGATCTNFYGATETPQAIAHYEVPASAERIPIGRGIDSVELLVLTPSGQQAGIGETGEICVRTPYLATGYLADPELTAGKFQRNPFRNEPADKLYRTGDLGRYLPDGNVEFLGRNDDQIKIRGYRIEPREVEALLLAHPQVPGAAVVAESAPSGGSRLVAYIAGSPLRDPSPLREHLRARLPDFMVPSAFVFLDSLPLLPSGKLDLKALPAAGQFRPEFEKTFVAPRSELELRLVKVWEEALGVRGIGIRDDFFDLGGHSLLGVRLLSRIESAFGKRLPLSAIFEARNIEQLSTLLREEGWVSSSYSLVPIQPCGSRPPLFGIHDLHYKDLAARLGPEQPIYGLRYGLAAHTRDGVAVLPATLEDLAAHYVEEMRSLQPEGPYYLMGLSFGGVVAFEMAQQLLAQKQQIALLALFDSHLTTTEHRLPVSEVVSNLLLLGPAAVLSRVKFRAREFRAKFRKGRYEPHVHHPWGIQRDIAHAYEPKPYSGKILLFKAANPSPTVFHGFDPPEVGWQKWAPNTEVYHIAAGHVGVLEEPHVRIVVDTLKDILPASATGSIRRGSR